MIFLFKKKSRKKKKKIGEKGIEENAGEKVGGQQGERREKVNYEEGKVEYLVGEKEGRVITRKGASKNTLGGERRERKGVWQKNMEQKGRVSGRKIWIRKEGSSRGGKDER